jgi:sigma-B regulation protein RsbU (phosphoserine phosphatase)
LELDAVLEQIMTTCRAILKADACSLMLVDGTTEELVFEVAQGPVADKLKGGFRLKKGEGIAGHVFETGKSVLIEDAYRDKRFHQDFDRKTGYRTRSILCVPLKNKDKVIGVSQVINKLDGSPFGPDDEETLSLLGTHAAIAIENARMHRALLKKQRMESDLAFATSIQLSFLPQQVPRAEGYRFRSHYQAAMEVGGDFYDFIPLSEARLGVLIGDVSGKGVASALYMARLTSDFRVEAVRSQDPGAVLEQVNNLLCLRSCHGMFVTLLYLFLDLDERSITFANAGHLPPVLWNKQRDHFELLRTAGGPPLGILPDIPYEAGRMDLQPDDCLVMLTDGLIEARNAQGDIFDWPRFESAVRGGDSQVERTFERIMASLRAFVCGRPQSDDTTVVLIGVEGTR